MPSDFTLLYEGFIMRERKGRREPIFADLLHRHHLLRRRPATRAGGGGGGGGADFLCLDKEQREKTKEVKRVFEGKKKSRVSKVGSAVFLLDLPSPDIQEPRVLRDSEFKEKGSLVTFQGIRGAFNLAYDLVIQETSP